MPIWFQEAFISALALALLHSLWQGAILGLVGVGLNARLRCASPDVRYSAYSLLLLTMFVVCLGTFCHLFASAVHPVTLTPSASVIIVDETQPFSHAVQVAAPAMFSQLTPIFHILVGCWAMGVILLSMRHLGGCLALHRLFRTATAPCSPAWTACAEHLAQRMGIRRKILLRCSSRIDIPCAFGIVRSCVLLPISAMAGLTPLQIEALIAHELAHLARHDVLFNTFQVCIETAMFYHPAVRWLSMQIREAREQRCDDLAIQAIGGDRAVYARALLSLEETRSPLPRLALGANGDCSTNTNTHLVFRIRRVLGVSGPEQRDPWAKGVVALGAAAVVAATFHPINAYSAITKTHNQFPAVGSRNVTARKAPAKKPQMAAILWSVRGAKTAESRSIVALNSTIRVTSGGQAVAPPLPKLEAVYPDPGINRIAFIKRAPQSKAARSANRDFDTDTIAINAQSLKTAHRNTAIKSDNKPEQIAAIRPQSAISIFRDDVAIHQASKPQAGYGIPEGAAGSTTLTPSERQRIDFHNGDLPAYAVVEFNGKPSKFSDLPPDQQQELRKTLQSMPHLEPISRLSMRNVVVTNDSNRIQIDVPQPAKSPIKLNVDSVSIFRIDLAPKTIVDVNGQQRRFGDLSPIQQKIYLDKTIAVSAAIPAGLDKPMISGTIERIIGEMNLPEDVKGQAIARFKTQIMEKPASVTVDKS